MAFATTRPTFTFHTISSKPSLTPRPKQTHFCFTNINRIHPFLSLCSASRNTQFCVHSVDISKEDTPTSNPESGLEPETEEEKFDQRRLEEKFAVLNTGIYECRSCGYKYDESVGDSSYPIPPGLPFNKIPDDWRCPTCGAAKSFFESKSVEIAGFAQNQQFGLGGNALTSGQKALLIYGSLLFFFVLFLSGYFLQ